MIKIDTDVLVIGGGMAGLVAGTVATESGARTVLVRKGQSATAMSSGAIDILGYLPDGSTSVESPIDGIDLLRELSPLHPYSILMSDEAGDMAEGTSTGFVGRAVEWLKKRTQSALFELVGDVHHNRWAPTVLGTRKWTCLVQDTMDCGNDPHKETDSIVLFVGIKGCPDFNANGAARVYTSSSLSSETGPRRVAHCVVEVMPHGAPSNVSSIDIARHMDNVESVNEFIRLIAPSVQLYGATHLALPPILGLTQARRNRAMLEKELGVRVFELLAFPPSIPGTRLQNHLENIYTAAGGRLLVGHEVPSFRPTDSTLSEVRVRGPRRDITVYTKSVILASGSFIGGGLRGTEHGVFETIFDLTTVTGQLYSAQTIRPHYHTNTYAISPIGHPIFECGVPVDPTLRPIGKDGRPVFENLFVAGSIMAGYNYHVEKNGLGVALTTGLRAGMNAYTAGGEIS